MSTSANRFSTLALPPSWQWVRIGDLHPNFQNGLASRGESAGSPTVVLRLADIKNGTISLEFARKISVSEASRRKYAATNTDILIIRVNGSTDIVGQFIPCETDGLVFCDHFIRMRVPRDLASHRFLALLGSSPVVRSQIERLFVSTAGQNTVNQGHISSIVIPMPPCAEQETIVEAIEQQFCHLDAGMEALAHCRKKLAKLRDVLPLQLLTDNRVDFGGSGLWPQQPEDGVQYSWARLSDICSTVVDCPHSTPKFQSEGMPCVDTTCISAGVIHLDRLRYVDPATYEIRVRRLAPQPGDLIFAREGTVGTAVVVPRNFHPCLGQRVMLFRPDPAKVDSNYMCLMVNSEIIKRQYRPKLLGTTVAHLNVRDAKALVIPLPPLHVQRAIAVAAERADSLLNVVEDAVQSSIARSFSLRSAILSAAFSGRLVPQDPADESTTALRERINAVNIHRVASQPIRVLGGEVIA